MVATSRIELAGALIMTAGLLLGSGRSADAQTTTISADPNPVQSNPGTTTVTWVTADGSESEVYVSINGGNEILFAGSSSRGSQGADWAGGCDKCEFRLYAGTAHAKRLATVTVTRRLIDRPDDSAQLAPPSSEKSISGTSTLSQNQAPFDVEGRQGIGFTGFATALVFCSCLITFMVVAYHRRGQRLSSAGTGALSPRPRHESGATGEKHEPMLSRRRLILAALEPRLLQALIGPLFGTLFFFFMFDARLLNPTYVDWLLPHEDSRMQLIGWNFFRIEPWHLPPGATTQYGLEMGSGIVFADAVPLFAFVFKIFRALLPDHFQYMGLWILTCYVAQGAMAWLLSGEITRRILHRSVIVAFFVTSPILTNRAIAHHALMGHWLLLAAIYLYVRPRARWSALWWCLLLDVAALVNPYLLYMTIAIWAADLGRRVWVDRVPYTRAATSAAIAFATLLATMWIAGYFTLPVRDFSPGAQQYGRFYAANLNSLWNPLWIPTLFFSPRPLMPGSEIEGSNYLGVGTMALVPIAALALVWRRRQTPSMAPCLPLAGVALILWALALSHHVAWDDTILFTVPLPTRALDVLGAIRSSARLIWVAYYALTLAVLAVVATRFRPFVATTILVAALAIQFADAFPRLLTLRQAFQEAFAAKPKDLPTLSSPFWQIAARHYGRILFVPVAHKPPGYDAFAFFAADHRMGINVGYFGRVSNARIDAANATLRDDLSGGTLRQDSLYVFWNGAAIENSVREHDGVGVVDGFPVVAPRWFEFDDCCGDSKSVLHHRNSAVSRPPAPSIAATDVQPRASGQRKATISASPNPLDSDPGRTVLTWSTGDGSDGEVYASINGAREILFAGASSSGSQGVDWIGFGDKCDFRLYAGKAHAKRLASVLVRGQRADNGVNSEPLPVPPKRSAAPESVISPAAGWLLVTERWAPGWRAEVNGTSAVVFGGNFVFRALEMPAGVSEVRFWYRSSGFPCCSSPVGTRWPPLACGRAASSGTRVGEATR